MSERAIVWVTHEQHSRNRNTGVLSPAVDTRPAEEFGERKILFHDAASHMASEDAAELVRERLSGFRPEEDYLVYVGHPALIAQAVAIVTNMSGGKPFKMLFWNNRIERYESREIITGE